MSEHLLDSYKTGFYLAKQSKKSRSGNLTAKLLKTDLFTCLGYFWREKNLSCSWEKSALPINPIALRKAKIFFLMGPILKEKNCSLKSRFLTFKDGRPYLFHSFRNKCFNKISFGNMLYFQNKL